MSGTVGYTLNPAVGPYGFPNWPQDYLPSPGEWQAAFANKVDASAFASINLSGVNSTLAAKLNTTAFTSSAAGIILSAAALGVVADGMTDDTAAWKAAIALCAQAGGGWIIAPIGVSIISSTLAINASGIHLIGMGRGGFHDQQPIAPATSTLRWAGPSGGTMVSVAPAAGAISGIVDWEVTGIHLDANSLAGTGLEVLSACHGRCDVFTSEFGQQGVILHATDAVQDWATASFNEISVIGRQINQPGAILRLAGSPDGKVNTCFNTIKRVAGEFASGVGMDLVDCDNNLFHHVYLQQAGGTGDAIVFNAGSLTGGPGAARNNRIMQLSCSVEGAPLYAAGSGTGIYASGPNYIDQYDGSNSTLSVVRGPGALLYIGQNTLPPGLSQHNDSLTGGYRTSLDGFTVWWMATGALGSQGTNNGYQFPTGLFKTGITSIVATPLGQGPNATYSINNISTSGFTLITGNNGSATQYYLLRAEGF